MKKDRAWFDAVIAKVPEELLDVPDLPGGWSVKDVLWHIAWGTRENANVARWKALVGSELWQSSEDERNAAVREVGRSKTLEEVRHEYGQSFQSLLAAVERLTDKDLNDPGQIGNLSERAPGWRPWRVLHDPNHYAEHGRVIEQWLNKRAGTG